MAEATLAGAVIGVYLLTLLVGLFFRRAAPETKVWAPALIATAVTGALAAVDGTVPVASYVFAGVMVVLVRFGLWGWRTARNRGGPDVFIAENAGGTESRAGGSGGLGNWHGGQVVIAWVVASIATFVAFVTPILYSAQMGDGAIVLWLVLVVAPPAAMLVVTWAWFGARSRGR